MLFYGDYTLSHELECRDEEEDASRTIFARCQADTGKD